MEIYNVTDQKIRIVADESYPAGEHYVEWDGKDMNGQRAASGVYFMKFTSAEFDKTIKMVLMK